MKQVLVTGDGVVVEDVPAPVVDDGSVLVRLSHSCVSAGTELSGITMAETPLWKRAIREPEKVFAAIDMARTQGLRRTKDAIQGRLGTGSPTGYSAAGVVVEIGGDVDEFRVGDVVACAGAGLANHAEYVSVPTNLVVRVPPALDSQRACTVTLGAIALQGVRRAEPTLGETFVVVGLGVLGQLTAQLLRANGVNVVATDLDRSRIELALELGVDAGVHPDDGDVLERVARLTGGVGADGVIITAASPSDEVVSLAFRVSRKKGRVVLVGDVGLDLERSDIYAKELDFRVSTSYGPGRYDRRYEEEGLDYPIGYVRWTENRNMSAYLSFLAEGRIDVSPIIGGTFDVDDAPAAYESLRSAEPRPLTVVLAYPGQPVRPEQRTIHPKAHASPSRKEGAVAVGVVGAGSFAQSVHLPNLRGRPELGYLASVSTRSGNKALAAARQFGARNSTTDPMEILDDPSVEAVIIATRHGDHAELAVAALERDKHVLLEKPLALSEQGLKYVIDAASDPQGPVLLTGFNRRFSPAASAIREATRTRTNPMVIEYRMNAGYIPLGHWVHGAEGGGRNLGEACHIYDLFTYLTDSESVYVAARSVRPTTDYYAANDNFSATVGFADGSVATLIYTAMGSTEHPKERMDVYCDGAVYSLDDYRRLLSTDGRADWEGRDQDKGHLRELELFLSTIQHGGDWPIPLWQQEQATRIALEVEELIRRGTDAPNDGNA